MHLISDLGGPGRVPAHPPGTRLVASVDVEWSKNYRITDGNRAFLLLDRVARRASIGSTGAVDGRVCRFWSTSLYLDRDDERPDPGGGGGGRHRRRVRERRSDRRAPMVQ